MRAPRLDGVAAGALLVLSMAVVLAPAPAAAQTATVETPASPAQTASVTPQASPDTSAEPPAQQPVAEPPAQQPAAQPAPAQQPAAAPAQPASPPAQPASAPAQPVDVQKGVPVPEPADVPPPTKADIGKVQLSAADQAVADRLRVLAKPRADRLVDDRAARAALVKFYEAREFAPIWIDYGKPSDRMKAAIARLRAADADGLDAADYAVPDLARLGSDPDAIAEAELQLTAAFMAFARHAQSGKVDHTRISPNIDVKPPVPEPAAVLAVAAEAKDIAAALEGFNPPHEGFKRLKAKLVELRGAPEDRTIQIPSGPNLKKGKKDRRVPALRVRLKVEGDPDSTVYDNALFEAVRAFQRSKGMSPTGIVNQPTVDALNGVTKGRSIDAILSNMERWRWLPRDLGRNYVMVNVPDFTLKVVRNGQQVFHTRIVTGKVSTPSPSFSAELENILVNPAWHVPQSIIYGQYLPALERDPSALARMGMVVSRNRDGSISVRQPPGERNALGRLKFNFSNKFQVYLHDTPQKHLFALDQRAHSAGCMRVQNPAEFAEVLLSMAMPEQNYTAARIQSMYGKGEQWLRFRNKIPVHLVYHNAYVTDAGDLVVKGDVYQYDRRTLSALNGKYMQFSERSQVVVAGRPNPVRVRTADRPPEPVQQQRPARTGFFLFDLFRTP